MADVVVLPKVYVIPATNFKATFPAPAVPSPMERVTAELCVSVLAYPVISNDLMVILADRVELLAPTPTPSKNTSSADPGTEALSCVLEAVPQFVFAVAFQLTEEPPPTQYLEAL